MNTAIASSKSERISTRKVRLVADAIRNMSVKDALATLALTHKRGANMLVKTLKSAVANAVNNKKMNIDALIIESLQVNEGAFLKRFRPSTRGRTHPFKKRSTHVSVTLKEVTK